MAYKVCYSCICFLIKYSEQITGDWIKYTFREILARADGGDIALQ